MATAVRTIGAIPRAISDPGLQPAKVAFAFVAISTGLIALALYAPITIALIVAVPVLAVWFWRAPARGVYVLVAGAVLIEIYPLGFSDSITDRIPLFLNLNNSAGLEGFPITPAEILMLTVAGVALARGVSDGTLHWPSGRLVAPYMVFVAVVLAGEAHGLINGGDFKTSLWEMRPQIYGFLLFFLSTTLIEDRRQLQRLAMVVLLAAAAKAFMGDFRYFFTLGGKLGVQQEVLAHEDSYFLAMLVVAGVAALIWMRQRLPVLLIGAVTPVAMVAMLANSRRAGVYALAAAIAVLLVLAYRFEPRLRKHLAVLTVILVVGGVIFLAYAWDKQYGITAQLVRPVRSLIDPTQRDFLSDQYRTAENANLKLTFQTSPVIGVGFGSPYLMVYPMADISRIYPLWNVIPHNSLMWVGMRMGAVGFVAFWGLIGLAILEGFFLLGSRRDPMMRAIVAVAMAAIVAEILVGYADLQLESYRNLIFLGAVLGVLNRISQMPEVAHV